MANAQHDALLQSTAAMRDDNTDQTAQPPKYRQRSRIRRASTTSFLWQILAVTLLIAAHARAQIVGEDICSCSPSVFEFQFDFSETCPPVNIPTGTGVNRTSCVIQAFGNSTTSDLVPVVVNRVDILELGPGNSILDQSQVPGDFTDGETFTFTSLAASADNVTGPDTVPRGLQLIITGKNAAGNTIINFWLMTYTNDCDVEPILEEGNSAGWTVFSDLSPPRAELCPVASESPSTAPTSQTPTTAPPTTGPPTIPPTTGPPTTPPPVTFVPTESDITFVPTMDPNGGNDPPTVQPTPVGGTPAPTPVGGTPAPTPVGGTPAPTPVGGTPAPTPVGGTPAPTPVGGTPAPTPVGGTPAPTPVGGTPAPTPVGGTPAPTPVGGTPPPVPDMSFSFSYSMSFSMQFTRSLLELENWDIEFGRAIPDAAGPQLRVNKPIKNEDHAEVKPKRNFDSNLKRHRL